LGHLRKTTAAFLAVDDLSSECLLLAAECLHMEGLFTELGVAPEFVEEGLDAVGSAEPSVGLAGGERAGCSAGGVGCVAGASGEASPMIATVGSHLDGAHARPWGAGLASPGFAC
jgi:hypothetical protein